MRLPLTCMECAKANVPSSWSPQADIGNGAAYPYTCPQGHLTYTVLQQQQFELLFEAAFYAVVDGYYREAVGTFAASLERFEEFALRVCCAKVRMAPGLFESAWKQVRNQSERQFGGHLFLYSGCVGKMPPMLTEIERGFRNSVIHKGTFCTEAEAMKFGERVRVLVEGGIADLRTACSKELDAMVFQTLAAATATIPKGASTATMNVGTIVTTMTREKPGRTLTELAMDVRSGKMKRWLR